MRLSYLEQGRRDWRDWVTLLAPDTSMFMCVCQVCPDMCAVQSMFCRLTLLTPSPSPGKQLAVPAGPFLGLARGTSQTLMNKKSDHYQGAPR